MPNVRGTRVSSFLIHLVLVHLVKGDSLSGRSISGPFPVHFASSPERTCGMCRSLFVGLSGSVTSALTWKTLTTVGNDTLLCAETSFGNSRLTRRFRATGFSSYSFFVILFVVFLVICLHTGGDQLASVVLRRAKTEHATYDRCVIDGVWVIDSDIKALLSRRAKVMSSLSRV